MENQVMQIAARIRGLRILLDFTPEEMARVTGVSVDAYNACESGASDFSFTFLLKCAQKFGVDISELTRTVKLDAEVVDAPVAAGDELGRITVSYNGVDYVTVPLLALSDVSANRFMVVKDAIFDFFRLTVVQILLAVLALAAAAVFVWWRLRGRKRRYGKSSRRYRHRSYRGRGRR